MALDKEAIGATSFLTEEWSEDEKISLDRWSQGKLIPGYTIARVTTTTVEGLESLGVEYLHVNEGWSLIVSQTCDVTARGPGEKFPFVQVCPVFNLDVEHFTDDFKNQAIGRKVGYLYPVEGIQEQGIWVADFRTSISVSKTVLLSLEPKDAFNDENALFEFARTFANRYVRPALAESLSARLVDILNTNIGDLSNGTSGDWYKKVEQVRLDIAPDRLSPTWVLVHVISEHDLTHGEKKQWLRCREPIRKLFQSTEIKFAGIHFDRIDNVNARDYRNWAALPIKKLGRPTFI